ncbi:MAG: MBL fold metallo-hydrolase [Candidatus Aenigmarchaeota archaeon]|nr:MBL fold metallo-hydrolase [Candidatus Aenigmarchaeota archaeon]
MSKITILGAGQEVGRSAILVEDKKSVVLDYGTKIEPVPPKFPLDCKPDFAVLSHAHLDHCGGAPLLFRKAKPPIYMTDVTLELSALLIKDSMKVARKEGYPSPFSKQELQRMVKHTKIVNYGEHFRLGSMSCQLYDAGHIPGSAGIVLHSKKSVFYTGDIQTNESNLLHGCALPKKVDVLITESTYGHKNHPERRHEEGKLLEYVEEALSNEGSVLLPVFAVGRSQEVLLILEKYADTIAIDGMVKAASEIIEDYGVHLKNAKKLRNILSQVKFIKTHEERGRALGKHQIIVSSAGMLGGGPAVHYLREIKDDANSKVVFTGFLIEGTPGRNLMQTSIFENLDERFEVKCGLHKLDLSAHADKSGLYKIIKHINPELVVCVHGDDCKKFAKDITETAGIEAVAPANGETLEI